MAKKYSPIVKNIGYMWHRKYVNWNKSHLIGYSESGDEEMDFRYQAGIYVLYGKDYEIIYIGQAGKGENSGLFKRIKDHTQDEMFCMWERFSWYGFYSKSALKKDDYGEEFTFECDVNEIMNVIEALLIRVNLPKFNKSSGSLLKEGEGGMIEWFYQKAEFEEQESKYEELVKKCRSLS